MEPVTGDSYPSHISLKKKKKNLVSYSVSLAAQMFRICQDLVDSVQSATMKMQ